jgi:hypothetical protein
MIRLALDDHTAEMADTPILQIQDGDAAERVALPPIEVFRFHIGEPAVVTSWLFTHGSGLLNESNRIQG